MSNVLRSIWHKATDIITHWLVAGAVVVATGFGPEDWFARLAHEISWPTTVDLRAVVVTIGIGVIIVDRLWYYHSQRLTPGPAQGRDSEYPDFTLEKKRRTELFGIANIFLQVLTSLTETETKTKVTAMDIARRDRVADYLNNVASLLQKASNDMRAGRLPYDHYAEAEYYIRGLDDVISPFVNDPINRRRLKDALVAAINSEDASFHRYHKTVYLKDFFSTVDPTLLPKDVYRALEHEIASLDRASGMFKAAAVELRATV